MYINQIIIENVRSTVALDWTLPYKNYAGWHVIIGDNGAGKSSTLRSVALALVGPTEAAALRQDWTAWLRSESTRGRIRLDVHYDARFDKFSGKGRKVTNYFLPVSVGLERVGDSVRLVKRRVAFGPERHVWSGKPGWFSASYGPFRRFVGGDKDYERIYYSNPRLAPHLSVFGEGVALTECLRWLQDLQFKKLEKSPEGVLLDSLKEFVNQEGFLPHKTYLQEISSKGVDFVDGNGCKVQVELLSDGYRSLLSMTFELIRQLSRCYGPGRVFDPEDATKIIAPGTVLIDEVDAHLHPSWQRKIGQWFRQHFPHIQFIVTTHSPLVCQAASVGTVFRLPKPGTDESGQMVSGAELDRLLYGNVLDAYSTELFGADVTRSDAAAKFLERLAILNRKELHDSLTEEERIEQARLRAMFPTSIPPTSLVNAA